MLLKVWNDWFQIDSILTNDLTFWRGKYYLCKVEGLQCWSREEAVLLTVFSLGNSLFAEKVEC